MCTEVNSASYDADGNTASYRDALAAVAASKSSHAVSPAIPLSWSIDDDLAAVIHKATTGAQAAISDIDLEILLFNSYGKGFIKKVGVSPDGFIQMALQLAYHR